MGPRTGHIPILSLCVNIEVPLGWELGSGRPPQWPTPHSCDPRRGEPPDLGYSEPLWFLRALQPCFTIDVHGGQMGTYLETHLTCTRFVLDYPFVPCRLRGCVLHRRCRSPSNGSPSQCQLHVSSWLGRAFEQVADATFLVVGEPDICLRKGCESAGHGCTPHVPRPSFLYQLEELK